MAVMHTTAQLQGINWRPPASPTAAPGQGLPKATDDPWATTGFPTAPPREGPKFDPNPNPFVPPPKGPPPKGPAPKGPAPKIPPLPPAWTAPGQPEPFGPVRNLIVEEVLQRNDQMWIRTYDSSVDMYLRTNANLRSTIPVSGRALIRTMPAGADPYREMPEEYTVPLINAIDGDFGNLERTLDLFRYKADQFWDLLYYSGQYVPETLSSFGTGPAGRILPFSSVRVDTDLSTPDFEPPTWKTGAIAPNTKNPFNSHYKEVIELTANPDVFGNLSITTIPPCGEQSPQGAGSPNIDITQMIDLPFLSLNQNTEETGEEVDITQLIDLPYLDLK